MFLLGERVKTLDEGKKLSADMIASGQAREKFREIVGLQGGDVGVVDDPRPPGAREADAGRHQRIEQDISPQSSANSWALPAWSWAAGGKRRKTRSIPAVGLEFHKRIGDAVERGEPLCTLHYNADDTAGRSARLG